MGRDSKQGLAAFFAFLLIGILAPRAGATDFTEAESTDWFTANNWTAGVPDANTAANIGTSGTGTVSVTITGTANAGRTQVGLSGGASVTGNVTISAGATLNTWGSFYNSDEWEDHGFDIGGMAAGNLTLEANAQLNMMAGDSMGLGNDDRWVGGYDTSIVMKPGSSITVGSAGSGWATFGLGDGNYHQTLEMDNATINGVLFHIGGTVTIKGTSGTPGHKYRARTYSSDDKTILKPVGWEPVLHSDGIQLRGLLVDISELSWFLDNKWITIIDGGPGTYWNDKDVNFVPGTPGDWQIRTLHPLPSGSERKLQVRWLVPEPLTLALFCGGAAALIRKRR